MTERRYDHVVVGAGVAGCVLAGRLGAAGRNVLLLDAGSGEPSALAARESFFDALEEPGRTFRDVTVEAAGGSAAMRYRLGRGVGGGSAVNAMILTPPLQDDLRRWNDATGSMDWSPAALAWTADAHRIPMERTEMAGWGSVDRALVDAATSLGHPLIGSVSNPSIGVGPATLGRRGRRRITTAEAYLPLAGENVTVVGGAAIQRVEWSAGRPQGVAVAADGRRFEGNEVVLSAGAFHSYAIVRRSGVTGARVGSRVQDHPSVRFGLRLREPNGGSSLAAATVLRWSSSDGDADLQLVPLNHLGPASPPDMGALVVTLLAARSTGRIDVGDDGAAVVALHLFDQASDRRRMREAVRHVADIVRTEAFRAVVSDVYVDDHGTRLDALALHDDAALDRWIRASVGDTYHAGATLPMGHADDPAAAVDAHGRLRGSPGIRVCDASIFPDLPTANPTLPLVMVAEQISALILREKGD